MQKNNRVSYHEKNNAHQTLKNQQGGGICARKTELLFLFYKSATISKQFYILRLISKVPLKKSERIQLTRTATTAPKRMKFTYVYRALYFGEGKFDFTVRPAESLHSRKKMREREGGETDGNSQ